MRAAVTVANAANCSSGRFLKDKFARNEYGKGDRPGDQPDANETEKRPESAYASRAEKVNRQNNWPRKKGKTVAVVAQALLSLPGISNQP